MTDVKMLTGQQYGERQELTLNVRYSTSADVETLRIDTAITEIRTETGMENSFLLLIGLLVLGTDGTRQEFYTVDGQRFILKAGE